MSEECTHDCSTCGAACSHGQSQQPSKEQLHARSSVKRVIGVVSGKGGVGKSLVTALLAARLAAEGSRTAVLDADFTGPSIPKLFGLAGMAGGDGEALFSVETKTGVQVMSINLLLDNVTDPVVWRGPVIAGMVGQFWSQVIWKDVDYMFVDMPPGTGDVPLTVFQSLPVDGIVVVASPQELVWMVVEKAVKMAELMGVEILGLVENMSYLECPDCKTKIKLFGKSSIDEVAAKHKLPVLAKLPLRPEVAALCDAGRIEDVDCPEFAPVVAAVKALEK